MLSTIYLFRYNNYYNRIVRKEETIDDYLNLQTLEGDMDSPVKLLAMYDNINFIPNDYVNTTQVVNYNKEDEPDYLIVCDEEGNISSRWFIISTYRVRAGQMELTLRRDMVVDFYNDFISTECFVEKGYPTSLDDPAVFNKEDMGFNQIKQEEYLLKDGSNCAWVVGYIPRDSFPAVTKDEEGNDEIHEDYKVETNYNYVGVEDYNESSLSKYKYYQYTQNAGGYIDHATNINYIVNIASAKVTGTFLDFTRTFYDYAAAIDANGTYLGCPTKTQGTFNGFTDSASSAANKYKGDLSLKLSGTLLFDSGRNKVVNEDNYQTWWAFGCLKSPGSHMSKLFKNFDAATMNDLNSKVVSYLPGSVSDSVYNEIMAENGKIFYSQEDQSYYRIKVVENVDNINFTVNMPMTSGVFQTMDAKLNRNLGSQSETGASGDTIHVWGEANGKSYSVKYVLNRYVITFELLASNITTTIPTDDKRYHLNDSPYDMFCIPFPAEGQVLPIYKNKAVYIPETDRLAGFNLAVKLASVAGSGTVYDVQLLPYCPFPSMLTADGHIDIGNTLNSPIETYIKDAQGNPTNRKTSSIIIWCLNSEFQVKIPFNIPKSTSIEDRKIRNETEVWRLCSPNYSGLFEFSPEKNDGVGEIMIDCNYKPYSPYLHASINFQGLYGGQFGDSRGLICGGDFSLPQVTSAWADYQLNNKNYQQMFDRGMQNMEVNNSVQREKEKWQAAAGTMQGISSGMSLGSGIGGGIGGGLSGGIGTILGGVGGGLFSGLAAKRDIELNDKLRNETLDYTRDMFGYQLGNIQALPQGLAKVSAFTKNNKIFPFLEKYGCTETEVEALKNKLKYNGYTIMRIGTFEEFINTNTNEDGTQPQTYIKGKLIRLPASLEGDYHIGVELAAELNKGVFI